MTTEVKSDMTAAELLHFYLGLRLEKGDRALPIGQILADFPEYLQQRESLRGMVHEAEEAIAAGRSAPLDLKQTIDEVMQELAAEGITE